jgi:hypothetical protein
MSWPGYPFQEPRGQQPEGYDIMQVCINGHMITDKAVTSPEFRKPFCPTCGAKTIEACPNCQATIQGDYHIPGVIAVGLGPKSAPSYCHGCGAPYPWRKNSLDAAAETIELQLNLDGPAAKEVATLVQAISIETPRTELAALKLKKIIAGAGKATYDIAIKVVSDVASETAKKALGFKP